DFRLRQHELHHRVLARGRRLAPTEVWHDQQEQDPKPEGRRPKEGRNPKPELPELHSDIDAKTKHAAREPSLRAIRHSAFGFRMTDDGHDVKSAQPLPRPSGFILWQRGVFLAHGQTVFAIEFKSV